MKKDKLKIFLKKSWKEYSIFISLVIASFTIGLLLGMGLTEIDTLKQILVQTISGIIIYMPWFILVYLTAVAISRAIKVSAEKIIKKVPIWLEDYEKIKHRQMVVERAMGVRK